MVLIVEEGKKVCHPFWSTIKIFLIGLIILGVVFGLVVGRIAFKYRDRIIDVAQIPFDYDVALVFGAGLRARGVPGLILEDRVLRSIDLYQLAKVKTILLSGDNQSSGHNEVKAMENLAVKEGVPQKNLLFDHSGLSTYESCRRAKEEFNLQKVVLVTQRYHLSRALYDCNELGLEAVGVDATRHQYANLFYYRVREMAAMFADWVKINFF